MSTKHTPGMWVYGNWMTGVEGEFDGASWVEVWAKDGNDKSLPIIACKHQDEMANARLIAASPRMYEYLAKLAKEGDEHAAQIISNI